MTNERTAQGPRWGADANSGPASSSSLLGRMGMTGAQARAAIAAGDRFVIFPWVVSVLILTTRQLSAVHRVRPGEGTGRVAMPYVVASLVFGWWGFPWGPIWTIRWVVRNLRGGVDVTAAVAAEASRTP